MNQSKAGRTWLLLQGKACIHPMPKAPDHCQVVRCGCGHGPLHHICKTVAGLHWLAAHLPCRHLQQLPHLHEQSLFSIAIEHPLSECLYQHNLKDLNQYEAFLLRYTCCHPWQTSMAVLLLYSDGV